MASRVVELGLRPRYLSVMETFISEGGYGDRVGYEDIPWFLSDLGKTGSFSSGGEEKSVLAVTPPVER